MTLVRFKSTTLASFRLALERKHLEETACVTWQSRSRGMRLLSNEPGSCTGRVLCRVDALLVAFVEALC